MTKMLEIFQDMTRHVLLWQAMRDDLPCPPYLRYTCDLVDYDGNVPEGTCDLHRPSSLQAALRGRYPEGEGERVGGVGKGKG